MTRGAYLGDLEEIVLLAVARLEPHAYGMSIRREIDEQSGRQVAIGAVYATLERLEDKGYVRLGSAPASAGRDGRPRRFFTITASGGKALEDAAHVRHRLWTGLRLRRTPTRS
jgi:PadR family transcriptional regulator, regulatory protein PadR